MSQTHEALREAQENLPAKQGSQRSVVSPGQFAEVKQVPRPSRKTRSAPSASPLFHPDPDENFKLWMQNCFPDVSLARGDALREWLARPVEARVQHGNNYRAETATSNGSEAPVATLREATDIVHLKRTGARKPKWWLGRNSHRTDGSNEDPLADRSALWMRRSLFKIVKYSFLALLLLSGPLMRKGDSLANVTIAATRLSKAEPAAVSSAPQREEPIKIKSDSGGPMIIESLSVRCKEAKPCIEISTRGKQTPPRLSTLSNPDRVVMDFQDAVFSYNAHPIRGGRGAIKAVRIGDAAQAANARVVIDLTEKCDYELYTLSKRLVLEVYRKGVPRPIGSSR